MDAYLNFHNDFFYILLPFPIPSPNFTFGLIAFSLTRH